MSISSRDRRVTWCFAFDTNVSTFREERGGPVVLVIIEVTVTVTVIALREQRRYR